MKKNRYLLFSIIMLFSCMISVHASCTDDEIVSLKKQVEDIKITYKHLGAVEDNSMIVYDRFDVSFKNIPDDFYLTLSVAPLDEVHSVNGIVKMEMMLTGSYEINVFSNKCEEEIDQIIFTLPKFNEYSLDPLCKGIDGDDFPLCGKYYEYKVDYDNFVARVKHYRDNYNIVRAEFDDDYGDGIFEKILDFISKNLVYVIFFLIVLLLIVFVIVMMRKRKKRGVLE